jgi:hypothetical protein
VGDADEKKKALASPGDSKQGAGGAGAAGGAPTRSGGGVEPRLAQRPELRVISWNNEEASSDALPINGYQHYRATDYRLDFVAG